MPRTWEDASYKLGENVFEFIGNYLLVALACVCCVLCAPRPTATPAVTPVAARASRARPAGQPAPACAAPGRAAAERTLRRPARRYKRPAALIGILVTSKAWDWLRKQEGGADAEPPGGQAGGTPRGMRSPQSSPRGGPRTPGAADAAPPPRPRSRLQKLKELAVYICACPRCSAWVPHAAR